MGFSGRERRPKIQDAERGEAASGVEKNILKQESLPSLPYVYHKLWTQSHKVDQLSLFHMQVLCVHQAPVVALSLSLHRLQW